MNHFIYITLLIASVSMVNVEGKTLEELIASTFNTTNSISPVPRDDVDTKPQPVTPLDTANGRPTLPIRPLPEQPAKNPCKSHEKCVQYFQCKNGSVITDGEGLLDIRFGEEDGPNTAKHPCTGLFETCCSKVADHIVLPPPPENEGCGFRNTEGVGFRIKGGKDSEAQFAEFKWIVAILKEEKALSKILSVYQCGGALITPNAVLTAAHCVSGKEPNMLKVRAGEWDTQTKDELFPHQDRDVVDVIIHPEYYKGGLFNDIALIFLEKPVDIIDNVGMICLPPQYFNFDESKCVAAGWGKDSFGKEGKYQAILKRVDLPIVHRDDCEARLRKTRLGEDFVLNPSFICAGGEPGRDTCKGDGGSPLVCPIPGTVNRYYQAGIVSWGIGCNQANPGVYVNVPLFRTWIDEELQKRNIDISFYQPK